MTGNTQADRAPFKIWCDGCGTDIDDPDTDFSLGAFAFVPDLDFLLGEVTCMACDTRTDAAIWMISKDNLLAQADELPSVTADAVALLDRYLRAVESFRKEVEEAAPSSLESPAVDLSDTTVVFRVTEQGGQFAAVPMRVLAAVQGLRLA